MKIHVGPRGRKGTIADLIEARYAVVISNLDKDISSNLERRRVEVAATGTVV